MQLELRKEISDEEQELLIDRLIKYSDSQLDEAFNSIAQEWDSATHYFFPNAADFISRMSFAPSERASRFAKEKCKKCGGSGWELVDQGKLKPPAVKRCACFVAAVKAIEAAKQQPVADRKQLSSGEGTQMDLDENSSQDHMSKVQSLANKKRMP